VEIVGRCRFLKLIVGLGNPGREYAATRHNVGFMAIDRLAQKLGLAVKKTMFKSLIGQAQIDSEKVVLAKPQTYMNLSGGAVGALSRWYRLTAADLIVIYDDMDLPPGKLRIRSDGGSGGHKGMKSIIEVLGNENITRVRIGIGKPTEPDFDGADYVLSRISVDDTKIVEDSVNLAVEAVYCLVRHGVERAMNEYNRK
jgi:PTH1 family peptidyl-tRNA hydrolase